MIPSPPLTSKANQVQDDKLPFAGIGDLVPENKQNKNGIKIIFISQLLRKENNRLLFFNFLIFLLFLRKIWKPKLFSATWRRNFARQKKKIRKPIFFVFRPKLFPTFSSAEKKSTSSKKKFLRNFFLVICCPGIEVFVNRFMESFTLWSEITLTLQLLNALAF